MMDWLKNENRQTSAFLRGEFASTLWMCAVAFGAMILLGLLAGLFFPDFAGRFIQQFAQQLQSAGIQSEDGSISAWALLQNNIRATIATTIYGVIPFIFLPALSLGINAILLGVFAAYYLQNGYSILMYLAAIVPHGILELPALVISIALGIYLCGLINAAIRHKPRPPMVPSFIQICRVLVLRVFPLLLFASLIEAYVTPWIVSLF